MRILRRRELLCGLAAAFVAAVAGSVSKGADAPEPARIETVIIETAQGAFRFSTEIADTPQLRERGLMFRHRLPEDRAMLFDWNGKEVEGSMWMRNTYIPLDMLFIDRQGRVVHFAENTKPFSLDVIEPKQRVLGVMEVVAGTVKRIGLKTGDVVRARMFGNS